MKAEYLVVDECSERKIVEEVGEVFPDICVSVLSETLIVEAIDLGDLAGFVVASEDGDALRVADFERDE